MTRQEFFDKKQKGALWDVGVSIKRGNPLPIDADSVFESKAKADTYAASVLAYPGQVLAVVEEAATTIYYIDQNMALQEVGKIPVGDGKSIAVAADGTISLLGLAEAAEGAQPVKQADGTIKWIKPDTTTVEGLSTTVAGHTEKITALENTVGDSTKGLVKDVADTKTNLADNYYDKTQVDGLVAGAFHFKGNATLEMQDDEWTGNLLNADGQVIFGKAGDVYQVEDKEYAYNGSAWVLLGFTLDLSGYATTAAMTTAIGNAKTELQTYADGVGTTTESSANKYTDRKISDLNTSISQNYATNSTVSSMISGVQSTAANDATTKANKAKEDAIADTTAKIGDLGDSATVKVYVDAKDAELNTAITNVKNSVDGLGLGALAKKDKVAETDLEDTLKIKINGKADAGTTLADYGITDAYTKTQADGKISEAQTNAETNASADATAKVNAAKTALIGKTEDIKSSDDTIEGAKKYAEEKVATVTANVTGLTEKVTANETAITKLNGADTVEGSVDYKIKAAKNSILGDAETATETDKTIEGLSKKLTTTSITLQSNIDKKQDILGFEGTYNKTTNPVTTKTYVDDAISTATKGLTGAMHYVGASDTDPTLEAGPTVTGHTGAFVEGDVVTWGNKEYVYDGTSWRELGDESSYIVKGTKFTNTDIADDAAIAQSKIDGLTTALDSKLENVQDAEGNNLTIINKAIKLPVATAAKAGLVKPGEEFTLGTDGKLDIKELNVNKLVQSEGDILILDCGISIR